jgi:hypothetical protein
VPRGVGMAEHIQAEQIPERVAKLRDQLKLLADYL